MVTRGQIEILALIHAINLNQINFSHQNTCYCDTKTRHSLLTCITVLKYFILFTDLDDLHSITKELVG